MHFGGVLLKKRNTRWSVRPSVRPARVTQLGCASVSPPLSLLAHSLVPLFAGVHGIPRNGVRRRPPAVRPSARAR